MAFAVAWAPLVASTNHSLAPSVKEPFLISSGPVLPSFTPHAAWSAAVSLYCPFRYLRNIPCSSPLKGSGRLAVHQGLSRIEFSLFISITATPGSSL